MENLISIELKNVSKKFNKEWIFKNLNLLIPPGDKLVILGGNGSGKSTLLQTIAGYLITEKGEVVYSNNNHAIEVGNMNDYISFASPYLQLNEDFNLTEQIKHIAVFKPFLSNYSAAEMVEIMELKHVANKSIKHFSSGMKQRAKLGIAILSNAPILLLDEPVSNLDTNAIEWYKEMINKHASAKTIIVCSNAIKEEYEFCQKQLNMADFK